MLPPLFTSYAVVGESVYLSGIEFSSLSNGNDYICLRFNLKNKVTKDSPTQHLMQSKPPGNVSDYYHCHFKVYLIWRD